MAFRFVHCADVHLDSPLRSLALRDPELALLVGDATRRAFGNVVDLCLAERVDALLLSGDLYDGDQTSMKTALFLGRELKRLDDAGVRVFVIRGNHDHMARITKELVLPDGATLFGGRADVVEIATGNAPIAVHGLSYAQAHAPESLVARYRAPIEGAINVGLLHTSLAGSPGHDPYAPCTAKELEDSGFRYWALGHVHKASVAPGRCTIAMPGMPQGRDVGEAGEKSALLVMVADDGAIAAETRRTSVVQFARVAVDVSEAGDWRGLAGAIGDALARERAATASEHLVARVVLTGTSALAWRVRRDADLLRTEAEARAGALGGTWIDKVEIKAAPPPLEAVDAGPLAELRRSMIEETCGASRTLEAVLAAMDDLRRQLPPECRDLLGEGERGARELALRLSAEGCEEVLARLREAEEAG